tara:strand:+ start:378 stop:3653 length:3276 start_codon:yes stop_codon:yes gene_type:complete
MTNISILHSRYIINDSNQTYSISDDNKYIMDQNNNKLFHLYEIPEKNSLYTIKLSNVSNILQVIIEINVTLLKDHVVNGLKIPSRNILFYLLRKNKNNQHLILNIIDTLNNPVTYNIDNDDNVNTNLNIQLYKYQIENNKWMLDLEKNKKKFEYVDNNIIKLEDLYIDIEKERFMFDYKYNKIQFDGGALIDSPGLGKCHLPDTYIYINNCILRSDNIWNQYAENIIKNEKEEIATCSNLYINSYNSKKNQIEKRPINNLYRQEINEKIKKITFENGLDIKITNKHKLLTEEKWTNKLKKGDSIAIANSFLHDSIKYDSNLIKLIALKEMKSIITLKNKFYIKCKSPEQLDTISLIMFEFFNINGFFKKYNKNYRLEYKNLNILKILDEYSLSTLVNASFENKREFINMLTEFGNGRFYSNSYKKMLELDIILRGVDKYLKITKCNRSYNFYIGTFKNIDNPNEMILMKIKKIENIDYSGYVYDFYIKETHNYIANNILCHNTVCMISLAHLNPPNFEINQDNLSEVIKDDEHLKSRATLIIAPNHLCEQWKNEINDKSKYNYKIHLITTKKEFFNTTYQDIVLSDFVIVSFQFLNNPEFKNRWKQYHSCYHHSIMDETIKTMAMEYIRNKNILNLTCPIFPLFHFHRLVVDECHELNNLKNHDYYYQLINLIKSDYRWCISGTPFQNGNIDFYNIFNILTYNANTECLLDKPIVNYITNNLFRRNTNESVQSEFKLNSINRTVVKLDFTVIERVMYDSYLSLNNKSKHNLYLKQLCCHPNLANKTKNALINCKTLDQINNGMIVYNQDILQKHKTTLDQYNTELQNTELSKNKKDLLQTKKHNIEENMKKVQNNINYFKEVIPRLNNKEQHECVICLNKIKNSELALTPCGHIYCYDCIYKSCNIKKECPICRINLTNNEIIKVSHNKASEQDEVINKYGTKIAYLINYLKKFLETTDERCIIFSQFDKLLGKIGNILKEYNINNIFCKGNITRRNKSINSFKYDDNYRIIMLSTKNTASGINLMCASTVLFLEPIYGTKDYIISTEKQAISRVYRIGQKKNINVVHFIIKDTLEEEIYNKYNGLKSKAK